MLDLGQKVRLGMLLTVNLLVIFVFLRSWCSQDLDCGAQYCILGGAAGSQCFLGWAASPLRCGFHGMVGSPRYAAEATGPDGLELALSQLALGLLIAHLRKNYLPHTSVAELTSLILEDLQHTTDIFLVPDWCGLICSHKGLERCNQAQGSGQFQEEN